MSMQSVLVHPRRLRSARPFAARVPYRTVGQSFAIEVTRDADGWVIRIPEIDRVTWTNRRAAVELTARECVATWTGIPIGYVAVHVDNELG